MAVIAVTSATFNEEVLESKVPVLVDFWADWCGPCKMLAPTVEQVSEEQSEVKFCKVNIDQESDLAMQYRVMSIPTLLIFKNGEKVASSVGALSKSELVDFVSQAGK